MSIEAEKIKLKAKSIEGTSEKGAVSMGEAVEITGKTVKIFSEDKAILELDKEAKLDGQAVKIKPGLAAEAKKAEEREEQAKDLEKTKVHLFDWTGKAINDAPYEVSFFGYLDEGTAADGTVEIPSFPDVEKAHVRWGRPKDQRPDPNDPDRVRVRDGRVPDRGFHADEDEALRRKLHNLGHQGEELYEAIHKMQAALGADRTGDAADVADEVEPRATTARSPSSAARRELEMGVVPAKPPTFHFKYLARRLDRIGGELRGPRLSDPGGAASSRRRGRS